MDMKRRALGVCIAAIIVLSCTLATASAKVEVGVNKTVWDPDTGTWVEEITAQVGDTVTFQINCFCTNLSELCPGTTGSPNFGLEDFEPENFNLIGINDTRELINGVWYQNQTRHYKIEGCSEGVNKAEFSAGCSLDQRIYLVNDTATVTVECPEAPALTPSGLIALVGLLSAIATVTLVRKRR
jgi:hypothetical protein